MESRDAEGKKFTEKALCCVPGGHHFAHLDYDPSNIYAPASSHGSIRILIGLVSSEEIYLEGADLINAYLFGDFNVSIIITQPSDSSPEPAMPVHACELTKSIFVAKQA